jgi:spoIIIJ-associated protein
MSFEKELEKVIRDLIESTPFSIDELVVDIDPDDGVWCKISSSDSKHLIGRNGESLIALSGLVKKIMEKLSREKDLPQTEFILDVNGYQKKRIDSIKSRAHMLAERARYFKSSVEAPPMTAFERRIVHDHLSKQEDITTESTGEGRERKVVVFYKEDSQPGSDISGI